MIQKITINSSFFIYTVRKNIRIKEDEKYYSKINKIYSSIYKKNTDFCSLLIKIFISMTNRFVSCKIRIVV